MKNLRLIFSCLVVCASTSLLAQTNLGSVNVGSSTTATITATIINPGTLASIAVTAWGRADLDFTDVGGGTCSVGTSYAANATCTVNVKFAPTAAGARYGGVKLLNQNESIAFQSYLQGMGDAPQTVFFTSPKGPSQTQGGNYYINPRGIAADGADNTYVAVGGFYSSPYPGCRTCNVSGYLEKDGGIDASDYVGGVGPGGVAVDGAGNLYDFGGQEFILKNDGTFGGILNNIIINVPASGQTAVDGSGNLYANCTAGICKETRQVNGSYVESTVAGGVSATSFAVDGAGNVYAANGALYKFTRSGSSYTLSIIGAVAAVGVAVDGMSNVYCSDSVGNVYKEALQADGSYVQSLLLAGAANRNYFAVDSSGNIRYFAMGDTNNPYGLQSLHEAGYQLSSPPTLSFANTNEGAITSAQTVTITNSGNLPLQFSAIAFPADFQEGTAAGECTEGASLEPGMSCTLTIAFAPVTPVGGTSGVLTEQVLITSNIGNAPGTQQAITVTGTENARVATPTVSLPAGVYYTTQTVTLSDTTPGAKIYYTLNGATPTTSSMLAKGPIAIKSAETLKAIAVAAGYADSTVISAYYALTAPTPVISPVGGTYSGSQTVTISTATPIEFIFYTTGNSFPTTSSPRYTGPITVSSSENVMAFAFQTGFLASPIVRQRYVITPQPASIAK